MSDQPSRQRRNEVRGKRFSREYSIALLWRSVIFITGIFTLSFGVSAAINAGLGVPTWDVLHIGLAGKTSWSIGIWVQIVGVGMIMMTSFLEKQRPVLGSIVNVLLVGFFIDLILASSIFEISSALTYRTILLLVGIVLMGFGAGMYVSSKIGAGPREGMTLYLSKRFSISISLSRTILEVIALTFGWLLGGPIALGTFVSVVLVGPVMQFSIKFWTRRMHRLCAVGQIQESLT